MRSIRALTAELGEDIDVPIWGSIEESWPFRDRRAELVCAGARLALSLMRRLRLPSCRTISSHAVKSVSMRGQGQDYCRYNVNDFACAMEDLHGIGKIVHAQYVVHHGSQERSPQWHQNEQRIRYIPVSMTTTHLRSRLTQISP